MAPRNEIGGAIHSSASQRPADTLPNTAAPEPLRYLSVCSGIEAATVAWHPLGWEAAAFSEIEAFPRAVLAHHYPEVPLHGDFTTIGADDYGPIDLLVGGTPCQSFSIAGLRGGLGDDRGNLALEFLRLAQRTRPEWLVWENVPGVLSSNGGRDFGAILGGMVELGYGFAYRVLDAQFFGVPQRRRRVFVVGHLGDWRRAAAVLFERHSLQGHSAPRREKGGGTSPCLRARANSSHRADSQAYVPDYSLCLNAGGWPAEVAPTLNAHFGDKMGLEDQHALNGAGHFVMAFAHQQGGNIDLHTSEDMGLTLQKSQGQAIAFDLAQITSKANRTRAEGGLPASTMSKASRMHVATSFVRRLTPVECERLQGFPDGYTQIPYRGKPADQCPDGPRYKALGNSMAVPVMRWIGERIQLVRNLEHHTANETAHCDRLVSADPFCLLHGGSYG